MSCGLFFLYIFADIGFISEIKIKVRFSLFYFVFHSIWINFSRSKKHKCFPFISLNRNFALYLDNIGYISEMKIKARFTRFYFVFHSICTIFAM